MAAVWALGRTADDTAKPALRDLLDSPYKLMRAQVARALGFLNDQDSSDHLLQLFQDESDPALRVAYASALAALARPGVLPGLLELLHDLGPDANALHRRREYTFLAVHALHVGLLPRA
jgi:HEAT repeat protein